MATSDSLAFKTPIYWGNDGEGMNSMEYAHKELAGLKKDVDPTGKDQHESGAKLDQGKERMGLILLGFPNALLEVGKIGTFGANKYTDNGWKTVPNGIPRYTDAMIRHLLKEKTEGFNDKEMDLPHAAAVAWNALARLELILKEKENDSRN